uniref:Uncharacterized protein n=1 Tax=Vibrio parahaemolyticus TaxID=670 RepID=A0A3T0VFG6_VIBPH|nr:hypothetical protein [Vibrio parahaemolyticus]
MKGNKFELIVKTTKQPVVLLFFGRFGFLEVFYVIECYELN